MKKAEEKKLRQQIIDLIGENYTSTDSIMIDDLIDWVSLSQSIKIDIEKAVKAGDSIGWQDLTKISMCSKQIIALTKALGISVYERKRGKKKDSKPVFDLNKFLNEN
jgi:hypothetical protein